MALTSDPEKVRKRRGWYFTCEVCGAERYAFPKEKVRRYCSVSCRDSAGMIARGEMAKQKVKPPPKAAPGLRKAEFDDTALANLKW